MHESERLMDLWNDDMIACARFSFYFILFSKRYESANTVDREREDIYYV